MAITKVWIEDGCTGCGFCAESAPEVFEVDDVAVVKDGVDFAAHEDKIKQAAEECPCEVIMFE
jgi:ferredoxin